MKNKTRKILDFLTQDVHLKHNYYLIGGILIILALVGYTSYSLFSYEHSESIYVSFKDTEKPVCVIGEPADKGIYTGNTTTFEMNCTDNYTVVDTTLTSSNFTITGDITISSIEKEVVGKGMKYTIAVIAGSNGGLSKLQLKANTVKDSSGNYNVASNVSPTLSVLITCDEMPVEESNANNPEVSLASNMIPICYNSTKNLWVKADSTNTDENFRWYSYSGKTWANAVTVTSTNRSSYLEAEPGTPIAMSDINTMWVWIPRFSAVGDPANYNGGTSSAPGAFNITFVDTETIAHDAFTFGEQNLSGMWMGKFENSSNISCSRAYSSAVGEGCNLNTIRPKILPNAMAWRGAMVSTFFYDILNMTENGNQYGFDKTVDTTLDTHMLKNNEWGAVTYLSQSIYGRCSSSTSCTEVGINNNGKSYSNITGYGAPAGSAVGVENGAYNTALGMNASTTGNIYGVYDMSGGILEYVMGVYWDGIKLWSGDRASNNWNSGFNGWLYNDNKNYTSGVAYPSDDKYYNLYTKSTDYTSIGLQHALIETAGWYGDLASFVSDRAPWFTRGGYYDSTNSGVFYFSTHISGYADLNFGSRTLLVK